MKISEFVQKSLGKCIQEIKTGSELLLFAECQRYLASYGEKLECDIAVDKRLYDSEYACYLIEKGVIVNFTCNRQSTSSDFYIDSVDSVEFRELSNEEWIFNYMDNPIANKAVCGRNRSKAYVSLLAYFLVYRAMTDAKPVLHIAQSNIPASNCEYVELMILQTYGNKLITPDVMFLEMLNSNGKGSHPAWEADVIWHRQLGEMCRAYGSDEKYKYAHSKFSVGDVVLLYKRDKGSAQDNKIRGLVSCAIAIIESISNTGVSMRVFPAVETVLTTRRSIDEAGGRDKGSVWSIEDYRSFQVVNKSISWSDIGVDGMLWDEIYFITEVIDTDGSYQDIMTEEGVQTKFLSTPETVYAVFENRKVTYDKDRFLAKYFNGVSPYYDSVRDIQPSTSDAISLSYSEMARKYLNRG